MFFFLLLYHDVNDRNKDIMMMIVMIDCNIFENTKRHRKINNFLLLTRLALGFFSSSDSERVARSSKFILPLLSCMLSEKRVFSALR